MDTYPSDRQVGITNSDRRAIVVEARGTILGHQFDDRSVFDPHPIDSSVTQGAGFRSSPGPTTRPTGSAPSTTNTNCPPAPNRSTTPPTTLTSHASPGRRRRTSPSPTSSGAQADGPGTASGGPIDQLSRSSGRRMAAGSSSFTSVTPWPHLVVTPAVPARVTRRPSRPAAGFCESADMTHMSNKERSCRCDRRPSQWVRPQNVAQAQHICRPVERAPLLGNRHRLISEYAQW